MFCVLARLSQLTDGQIPLIGVGGIATAEQAYAKTWVPLPREQWPEALLKAGLQDPVCPLILAFYGHR